MKHKKGSRLVTSAALSVVLACSGVTPAFALTPTDGSPEQFVAEGSADAEKSVSELNEAPAVGQDGSAGETAVIVQEPKSTAGDLSDIEFVYIESDTLDIASSDQQVVISFADAQLEGCDQVALAYSLSGGQELSSSAAKIEESAALFTLPKEELAVGSYQVKSVSLHKSDGTVVYSFDQDGVSSYGFDAVVGADEEGGTVSTQSYFVDESGSLVKTESVNDAITSASEISAAEGSQPLLSTMDTSSVVVVLDPGHGGSDSGAVGVNGIQEKNANLSIAQYCKAELEQYYGVTVYMTRNSDVYVSLDDRAAYAASVKANVLVSIHNNSASASAHGSEVIVPNSASYNYQTHVVGTQLGEKVLKKLVALGLTERSVYDRSSETGTTYPDGSLADYYAMIRHSRESGFPGIIIEHAFVTNAGDVAYLTSESSLRALGIADASAIAEQFNIKKTDEKKYEGVYDYDYYVEKNADVAEAYNGDRTETFNHFVKYGMKEGRPSSPIFDLEYYKNKYADLRPYYGSDNAAYYSHFSANGMSEGRQGSSAFSAASYYNEYSDLRSLYGKDWKSYYIHYVNSGRAEGRNATGCTQLRDAITTYLGRNWSSVYDANYYAAANSDVAGAAKSIVCDTDVYDDDFLIKHFVNFGIGEGRRGSSSFDVGSYYNAYRDLRSAYGRNWQNYYTHYIDHGRSEGRVPTGTTAMVDPVAVYGGKNWSPVYDMNFYVNEYSDLKSAFGKSVGGTMIYDDSALIAHFVNSGMGEARQGSSTFHLSSYYNAYSDLRNAYGKSWKSYYVHYVDNGRREGRTTSGVTTMIDPRTSYAGRDWSPVYDMNYYLNEYPDLAAAFSKNVDGNLVYDDTSFIAHFVNNGMSESRQGSASFDPWSYYREYPDLRNAYGTNWKSYYIHYLDHGRYEGRDATGCDSMVYPTSTPIMGSPQTTIDQMVRRYQASGKTYPSGVYAKYGAASIRDFCTILYEEAVIEGVRPEVVFAQAMHETGYLQFGGDVVAEQCNFAGIGATGGGVQGNWFNDWGNNSVAHGLRAQVQHLKAYASTEYPVQGLADPRYNYVEHGCAPTVEELSSRWAVGSTYGEQLIYQMNLLLNS